MPLSNSDFGIRINTEADLAALKQTLAALEADTQAAQRMGLSIGDAGQELAKMRSTVAAAEKALHDHSKSAEEAGLSHRELKIATTELMGITGMGGLRGLIHGMFSPEAMGLFGAITAIEMLKKRLEEYIEKTKDAIQFTRELKERFEDAHVHAVIEATSESRKFNDSLTERAANEDALTKLMDRQIAVIKQQAEATKHHADALDALYAARTRNAVAEGKMTPQEGEQHIDDLQRQARDKKDKADDAESAAELGAKRRRMRGVAGEVADDQLALSPLRKQSRTEAEALETEQGELDRRKERLKRAQEVADSEELKLSLAIKAAGSAYALTQSSTGSQQISKTELARKDLEHAQADVQQAEIHLGDLKDEHEQTTRKISVLEDEIKSRLELGDKLREEIHEINQDNLARQKNRAADNAANDATKAEERLGPKGRAEEGLNQPLVRSETARLITSAKSTLTTINQANLRGLHRHLTQDEIAGIFDVLDQLSGLSMNPVVGPNIQAQLNDLKTKINTAKQLNNSGFQ